VVWTRNGEVHQLSTYTSYAAAINDNGIIVGSEVNGQATWWDRDGVAHHMGQLYGGLIYTIDPHGLMGGVDATDGAIFTKTTTTHVGLCLPGINIYDYVYGIRNGHDYVGTGVVGGSEYPLSLASHVTPSRCGPLPSLGEQSSANAISQHGVIVGSNWTAPRNQPRLFTYAVQWIDDQVSRLPWSTDFAEALAVNAEGRIVGDGQMADGSTHAVLWKQGVPIDLNDDLPSSWKDAGWVMTYAYAINDHGWIVGEMSGPGGQQQGWLLKRR
jgi:probable HAF family extracellular repeat protein